MNKLSSSDVKNILADVPGILRTLNEKCASLQDKVAYYEKKERVEKIAKVMEVKNLNPDLNYEDKVTNLMNFNEHQLDVAEEAASMNPKQIELGSLDKQAANSIDANIAFFEELLNK